MENLDLIELPTEPLPDTGPKTFQRGQRYLTCAGQDPPRDMWAAVVEVKSDGPIENNMWEMEILKDFGSAPDENGNVRTGSSENRQTFTAPSSVYACRSLLLA